MEVINKDNILIIEFDTIEKSILNCAQEILKSYYGDLTTYKANRDLMHDTEATIGNIEYILLLEDCSFNLKNAEG